MPTETITGGLAILGSVSEVGPYEKIVGGLAITFGRQVPIDIRTAFLAIGTYVIDNGRFQLVTGGLAIETALAVDTTLALQTITGGLAIESYAIQRRPLVLGTSQPIADSTATGVLPMIGSAIFTRWDAKHIKETRVHTHEDFHESSGLDDNATRHRWELAINVNQSQIGTHWDFITSHYGNGKPFYFYDLQNNGFQYDGTGVLLTGRYLCRFDTAPIAQVLQVGQRYVIEYSVLEVE